MSETSDAPGGALLTAVDALNPQLRATLLSLGAVVVDGAAIAELKPAENLDEVLVITLDTPIDGPGGPYTHVSIREPSAGEMMMWDKLEGVPADVKAVSVVAAMPEAIVQKLPARVFIRASRRIAAFLR